MQNHHFKKITMNCISYNYDSSLIGIGTSNGFIIFSTNPILLRQSRDFGAPIMLIEIYDRSNFIAMVGDKTTPFAPPHKLILFNDNTEKIIADMSFKSNIKSIRIRKSNIIVALYNKVFVIQLFKMQIQHIINTFSFQEAQKYNIIALNNDSNNLILALPGIEIGHVFLVYLLKLTERTIRAHQSILSAIQLTQNGQKIATTSEKGIQIRIFDTHTGQMLQEVRRGNQFATIYSLVFNQKGNWLAVSSDSSNIHMFAIKSTKKQQDNSYEQNVKQIHENPKPLLYFMKGILPYFDTEYSLCCYKIQDYTPEMQMYLGFNRQDQLIIINNFWKINIIIPNINDNKIKKIHSNINLQSLFV